LQTIKWWQWRWDISIHNTSKIYFRSVLSHCFCFQISWGLSCHAAKVSKRGGSLYRHRRYIEGALPHRS
ncbi:unnamed protein product, partial [Larinioides sclopetarius]